MEPLECETGLGAITDRIRSLSKQEEDLIASNEILTQEYDTESHRLSLMTRSQDEIKRLADQLDDNEVRMKLQTEVGRSRYRGEKPHHRLIN